MNSFNPELLITNIGFAFAFFATIGIGIFALYNAPKRTANRVFFLYSLAASVFILSHVIGINIADPYLSRFVFLFNMSTILASVFTAHWVLALVNRDKQEKIFLYVLYALAFAITGFYIIFPDTFLLPSVPKLYFINYYVPGKYYFIGDIYFYSVVAYFSYHLVSTYIRANVQLKNRIKYVVFGLLYGYILVSLPALLLYGTDIDPILSSFFGLYMFPLAYGLIKEELLDIHVIAKQALSYASMVALTGLVVAVLNYANIYLILHYEGFPFWLMPIISGIIFVTLARFVWNKLKMNEELKYQFVTVATHKFRTPLTQLKWSIEDLRDSKTDTERKEIVDNIENAGKRISDLTATLIEAAQSENKNYTYKLKPVDLHKILIDIIHIEQSWIKAKKIDLSYSIDKNTRIISDERNIYDAIQAVIENAIAYTPPEGKISILETVDKNLVRLSIKDTGIGIAKENIKNIFTKFYRTHQALLANTEGVGIALYIAKNIIEKHGGKIWVESEGAGKGSTFHLELPKE